MNDLTKIQVILLVLLVSFVTSLTTVVVTISILDQVPNPTPQTILQKVIQRVVDDTEETELSEREVITITEEDRIIKVAEKVSPAVVSIIATKDLPVVNQFFMDPFDNNLLQEFFGYLDPNVEGNSQTSGATERREIGRGTGFIVSPEGLLITNKHVVADPDAEYTVILNSGITYTANVLARDPIHDIAIIKIDGDSFPIVSFGNSDEIRIGQTVIAIGNALGQFQNTVSVGVISGAERTLTTNDIFGAVDLPRVVQTDAAINPGNSGGPLLNTAGKVIGINTAIISGAENIGFAVPANIASRDLKQVQTEGRIVYPFLGVQYVIVTNTVKEEYNISEDSGVLLLGDDINPAIVLNSPAASIGLREGDIITHINNQRIDRDYSLAQAIQVRTIGDTVTLTVVRDTKTLSFTVTLVEAPTH
jgi:serine protease Do